MTDITSPAQLADVITDFATGDFSKARLAAFVRRFPAFEDELRGFARDAGALLDECPPAEAEGSDITMVQMVMQRVAGLHQELSAGRESADVFDTWSAPELRSLARRLELPMAFMDKLRSRLIEASTIPEAFIAWLARGLGVTETAMLRSLGKPALAGVGGHFLTDAAPGTAKQSFEEALVSCPISEAQRARIRALALPGG